MPRKTPSLEYPADATILFMNVPDPQPDDSKDESDANGEEPDQ